MKEVLTIKLALLLFYVPYMFPEIVKKKSKSIHLVGQKPQSPQDTTLTQIFLYFLISNISGSICFMD